MKKAVYFFLTLFCFGLLVKPVFGVTLAGNKETVDDLNKRIAEKKIKIEQIEKSIEDYKNRIKQKQLEAVSLSNQMSILDNRVTEVGLDISATEEKLSSLTLEIEALELNIQDKENTINKQKKILGGLIRSLYLEDGKGYLEIAFAYDSFSDFYNRLQYLETVQDNLSSNVHTLKVVKEDLGAKKQQVSDRKLAYENLNESLKEKKSGLSEQLFLKENLLVQTKNQEKTFNTLLSNLRSQYQAIEGEITSYEKEVRRQLEEQEKFEKLGESSGTFMWPVPSRVVTSPFHDPDYPYRHVFEHNGTDMKAAQGTPVKAASSGYIARAKKCSLASCYSYVMIIHNEGLSTVYGHLSSIVVAEDQFVTKGDVIGYSGGKPGTVGAGPFVTGPHLHFEVRKNGIPVDAANYLN